MGVRKEEGKNGVGRLVIDRRPRKSLPVRPQYREFGGRVENTSNMGVAFMWISVFLVLAVFHTLLVTFYGFSIAYIVGFGTAMIGVGYFLHALVHRRRFL